MRDRNTVGHRVASPPGRFIKVDAPQAKPRALLFQGHTTMNPPENLSTEPKHLVGVRKTCPRLDCPNPDIGVFWKGSSKQLQYHCYGCWRKFNYGGVPRSWAKQVSPPSCWLRRHAPDVKEAPKLLELQPPSRAVAAEPSRKRTHIRPSRRSVAKSSETEANDGTTIAVHAAEPSLIRTRRANVINEKVTAIATSGEDHGIGIAGGSTLPLIGFGVDEAPEFNGFGDEEAHHGPGTRTSPTLDNVNPTDMMDNVDDLLGEDGFDFPVWRIFESPVAHVLWDNEVDGAGIVSVAAIDNNPTVQGPSGLINAASGNVTEPRRRAVTITFRRYSVPSKTIYL